MSFKLTTPKNTRELKSIARATALTTTVNFLLKYSLTTGALSAAANTTDANELLFIANESLASGTTPVSVTVVDRDDEFLVDTVNNSNSAHNGQRMILDSTGGKLNNTGTDSTTGVFVQVDVVGAAADKKIIARHV